MPPAALILAITSASAGTFVPTSAAQPAVVCILSFGGNVILRKKKGIPYSLERTAPLSRSVSRSIAMERASGVCLDDCFDARVKKFDALQIASSKVLRIKRPLF